MYIWRVVGHDTSEGVLCSGIGEDLAAVMRLSERYLAELGGFAGYVVEVAARMSVIDLDVVQVATGREWLALRDSHGGFHWAERHCPADPAGPGGAERGRSAPVRQRDTPR